MSCVCTEAHHYKYIANEGSVDWTDCYKGQEALMIDTKNQYFIRENKKLKIFHITDTTYLSLGIGINRITLEASWKKNLRGKSYIEYFSQCKKSDKI